MELVTNGRNGPIVWRTDGLAYPIALQKREATYTVTYGVQIEENLDYADACKALGGALMHAISLKGE